MQIEIVAIADEILAGHTLNSNATFMSLKLLEKGYEISSHVVYSDDPKSLKQGLIHSIERSDLLLVCGGLGPTMDDQTKKVICEIFSTSLVVNTDLEQQLNQRFPSLSSNREQASVPKEAKLLVNPIGSASGLIMEKQNKRCIFMPGVPSEMIPMFLSEVLPFIEKHYPLDQKLFFDSVCIVCLAEEKVDTYLKELKKKYPEVVFGIYPSLSFLRVFFRIKTKNGTRTLKSVKQELLDRFHEFIFVSKNGLIEEAVSHLMIQKKYTLALAESCTGGAIASKLVSFPGATNFFLGSVVCYSNQMKQSVLKVSDKSLKEVGAVSHKVVVEMAKGVLHLTQADFAMATSGIAGPEGGSKDKPVGTVYIALAKKNEKVEVKKIQVAGERSRVIEWTANYALASLFRKVNFGLPL